MKKALFSLFRRALTKDSDSAELKLDGRDWKEIYKLAKKHDLGQFIGYALKDSEIAIDEGIRQAFDKEASLAFLRYAKSNHELNAITEAFKKAEIDYLPLKGSVIRKHYPEPWLRTSCDIDVLIKKEDLEKARKAIINELDYAEAGNSTHDVSFTAPSGVCLELHFTLLENDFKASELLDGIWSGKKISKSCDFEYCMSNELFLLYHVYHTAKHFINGGCGIKPLIDLWIIKNKIGYDEDEAADMLRENGLLEFYRGMTELANAWFDGQEHTKTSQEMEDYILEGGVYGTLEQHIAMAQTKKGGKFKNLLSRIFISYNAMLVYYPSLIKCPLLFPLFQIRRWFRIMFFGGRKKAFQQIKLNQNLSELKKEKAKRLIDGLGL